MRKKSYSTRCPTTKALNPLELSGHRNLFFVFVYRALKQFFFLSGPAFTPPPLFVVGTLVENFFAAALLFLINF